MRNWLRAKASRLHSLSQLLTKIEIGNFLIALSTSGLMALGVVPMSLSLLVALAILFLLIGIVGRYVDAVKDDEQRLEKYEQNLKHLEECVESEHSHKDSVCNNISTSCNHAISQSSDREKES